jgi:hypothetical protein
MKDPESFLTRWSRRKYAAALEREEILCSAAPSPAPLEEAAGKESAAGTERLDDDSGILPTTGLNTAAPPFDPLSVPPIESITADTDIRCFLAPGVPPELTRAALRRAWAADPKIRDFVGLADYDWDFNALGSMPGFGSLEMTDELRRMAARIVGPASIEDQTAVMRDAASTTSDQISDEPDLTQPVQHQVADTELAQDAPIVETRASCKASDLTHRDQETRPPLPQSRKPEHSRLMVRQRHGTALPK